MKKISVNDKKLLQDSDLYYVGIDAGSVSLNCIVVNDKRKIIYEFPYKRHLGKVEEGVLALIQGLYERFGQERIQSISFTGNHGKKLSEELGTFYEFETISQVLGAIFLRPDVKTIISMGGQETALLQINHYDGGWELEYFNTNGP
jgi:activator of 2-hydroxyglutaryl-CoA dehydratase